MDIAGTFDLAAELLAVGGRPVVTIGTFDGVHRGHQAILGDLTAWAAERGAPAAVITFQHHPRLTLAGASPEMITTVEHRLVLFERLGIDLTIVVDFNDALSQVSAEDFVEHYAQSREWEEREFRKAITDWELARYFEII